ncbi:MAG TPA: DUF1273 domain-containing protein [Clostridiales bacterium]|nr:DUF1273 domain-containing protein [Clostridiales bacterium]
MNDTKCSFTGHRPERFAFGFNENDPKCIAIKGVMAEQIAELIAGGVTDFYSGMARGVDQWAAEIVLNTKESRPDVTLTAVIPHEEQATKWSDEQRDRYFDMHPKCDDVVTLQTHYTADCMFKRNRYLVDHAGYLLAVSDGDKNGGTAYTLNYARQHKRKIIIINAVTLEVSREGF